MRNIERNHLICELMQKNKSLEARKAQKIASKILRRRRNKKMRMAELKAQSREPLTARTKMWFGKHRGKPIQEISGEYWAWFLEQNTDTPPTDKRIEQLKDFLVKYLYIDSPRLANL